MKFVRECTLCYPLILIVCTGGEIGVGIIRAPPEEGCG